MFSDVFVILCNILAIIVSIMSLGISVVECFYVLMHISYYTLFSPAFLYLFSAHL